MKERNELGLEIEELEERIAPILVTVGVTNPGVEGTGTLDTDAGTASGSLDIANPNAPDLSGSGTLP